jgi:hypothetical protein
MDLVSIHLFNALTEKIHRSSPATARTVLNIKICLNRAYHFRGISVLGSMNGTKRRKAKKKLYLIFQEHNFRKGIVCIRKCVWVGEEKSGC